MSFLRAIKLLLESSLIVLCLGEIDEGILFDKSHLGGRLNLRSHLAFDACIRLSARESPDS